MNLKKYAEYILKEYSQEILEPYYDQKGRRKNKIKNHEKLTEIKEKTKELFQLSNLTTELKCGIDFNFSDTPWIFIHDNYNTRATKQDYIGISFNKDNNTMEIWIGFGKNGLKKKERKERQEITTQKLKTIAPTLERNFQYQPLFKEEATMISKAIKLEDINDNEIREDLEYLAKIYLKYSEKFCYNATSNNHLDFNTPVIEVKESTPILMQSKKIEGINLIYKGFPGTGKSYLIKENFLTEKDNKGNPIIENGEFKLINEFQYETIVFFPEYTNANFIGSILPVFDNGTPYQFVPGPFTKILKKAIHKPKTNFYLIIEEINRGNAEAIFGDILLLLDRKNNGNGRSIYEITNESIAKYVYNDKNKKIYIPENLSIIATMNSSDQNVVPLDTAFERRWDTIWITDDQKPIDLLFIKGFANLKWGTFRTIINQEIKKSTTMIQMEDKKLGAYFINNSYVDETPSNREKDRLRFTYKVLTYLYETVCKYDKKLLFHEKVKCIDDLITLAKKNEIIFNEDITNKLREHTNE